MEPKAVSLPLELGQGAATGIALDSGSPKEALGKIVLFTSTPEKWAKPFVQIEMQKCKVISPPPLFCFCL